MSHDPEIVSKNLQKIHSKDTSIELKLRKVLWHKGYRYRKNYKILPALLILFLPNTKSLFFATVIFFMEKTGKF